MLRKQTRKVAACQRGKWWTASFICTVGEGSNCSAFIAAQIWFIQEIKLLETGAVSIWGCGERAWGWNHSCSNKRANGSLSYAHMCRCRLISASICGKCHLAKEHVTRKQMLRVHAQGLLLAGCTGKGSSPACAAWWPLERAVRSVHCWATVFRYGQSWFAWHTEGLWLMESPEADPGINAQSSTFLTLLLPVPMLLRLHNPLLASAPCMVV